MVSLYLYTDTWSLSDKAKFAVSNGMAGCFTWALDQVSRDNMRAKSFPYVSQDDGLTLQNAIRKGLGKWSTSHCRWAAVLFHLDLRIMLLTTFTNTTTTCHLFLQSLNRQKTANICHPCPINKCTTYFQDTKLYNKVFSPSWVQE